jgi:glycosyltransferase involved in cell wall biosynthesis
MERIERQMTPRFALNLMMSDVDAQRLRVLAPGARTLTVPNGVDTSELSVLPEDLQVRGRVVFVGPTYMFPNRDGVEFFLQSIWPNVRASVPHATFHTAGRNAPEDKIRFERHDGVTCEGYVPHIAQTVGQATCCVVPLRIGGGTRLKILDAWALGRAVVSTSLGCEGLRVQDGVNILIQDDPVSFAEAVRRVLSDHQLRASLEREGRKTAEEYDWNHIGRSLREAYLSIAEAGPR